MPINSNTKNMFKKISGFLALILFTALFSCSSDSDGNGGGSATNGSIAATVDGQSWESINGGALASITNFQAGGNNGLVMQIIAAKADQSSLTMQFPITNLSTGTYTFSGDMTGQLSYVSSFSNLNIFSSAEDNGAFTITITEVDTDAHTISGTFSGTLVDFMGTETIEITNGVINNIAYSNTELHSNGAMSLTNNGNEFTLNDSPNTGATFWIYESSIDSSITVLAQSITNTNATSYSITLPKDVTPGTYSLTSDEGFDASYSNNEDPDYNITEGSITIVSHVGNTIVATFNFNANNSLSNAAITNGNLTIEHND